MPFLPNVYGYPSSCPRAHCTPNKSVPTLRHTRRHGPIYTGPCPKALTECSPLDFRRSSIVALCIIHHLESTDPCPAVKRRLLHQRVPFVCFDSGGMLALGAKESDDEQKYLQLGADIAHTCHESYSRTGRLCSQLSPPALWPVTWRPP